MKETSLSFASAVTSPKVKWNLSGPSCTTKSTDKNRSLRLYAAFVCFVYYITVDSFVIHYDMEQHQQCTQDKSK